MVFTGIPVYLDPPNWQRHEDQHAGGSCATGVAVGGGGIQAGHGSVMSRSSPLPHNYNSVQILHRPVPEMIPATTATASSSRPILMAERARLAKVPPPDTSLKCPRCESTNTKFCYYNNYSLTQPRHFCKTCRRYWTKGGALRNVPVGGGCRRNKRNKSNTSTTNCQGSNMGNRPQTVEAVGPPTSSGGCATLISSGENIIGGIDNNPHPPIPFLPTIHGFNDYNRGTDIGLSFPSGRDLVMTNSGNSLGLDFMSPNETPGEGGGSGGLGQWRMQRYFSNIFPRQDGLPHMEPQLLLPFDGEGLVAQQYVAATTASQQRIKPTTHLNMNHTPLKMEDNQHQNIEYWNSNAWGAELSNFPSTASNSFV